MENPVIDSYLAIYEVVEEEIKKADRAIGEAGAQHEEVKLLTSITGIGVYSSLLIYSEIGDGSRFPTEDHVFLYAGLVPRVHQSGSEQYHGRITKEGGLEIPAMDPGRSGASSRAMVSREQNHEALRETEAETGRKEKIAIVAAAKRGSSFRRSTIC